MLSMINNIFLDSPALWITNCIHGNDEGGRLMRRTIMRYINLSVIFAYRVTSKPVKKRFPLYDHLVEAGILEKGEKKVEIVFNAHLHVLCIYLASELERNNKTSIYISRLWK